MYRYIKAIAVMAFSAALFLAAQLCVYANNDYLADINPETEMEATTSITVTVDYVGNYVYENGTLKKILFEGGYVDMTGSTPKYMYYLTDHLGNVRVVADSEGNIAQVNHYYPYGDRFSDNRYALSSSSTSSNDHLFGGKELDSSSGLHDFEARYDNTKFGRFTTMDPMVEKHFGVSPYSYCAGNPANSIDPDGKDDFEITNLGRLLKSENEDPYDRLFMSNGNSMIIKDKSILANFKENKYISRAQDGDQTGYLIYATTNSKSSELYEVFGFIQNNSNVEWGLYQGEDGKSLLGTTNDSDKIRVSAFQDLTKDYQIFPTSSQIHGHPNVTQQEEISSMEADYLNKSSMHTTQSFVYFPETGTIFQVFSNGVKKVNNYKGWKPKK